MLPAIQGAYDTVRQSLAGLSDNGLARCGFRAELETCVNQFRQKCEADVALSLDESCLSAIPDEARLQLLRILQESLANVQRHAHAGQVRVTVEATNGSVVLIVADDGKGFDPMVVAEDGRPHLGLKIMRGRAERVGGSLIIQSRPGEGTKIVARVPLQ
jgi:signal transduction histidine kinase